MKTLTAIVLFTAPLLATGAAASDIYKWVDSEGNVHFGDRPTVSDVNSAQQVERVAIASSRSNTERVAAGVESRIEQQSQREEARKAAEAAEQEAEAERAEAADQAKQCQALQQRQQQFTQSRRIYRVSDAGEREYLDDSQMANARQELAQRIQETCAQ